MEGGTMNGNEKEAGAGSRSGLCVGEAASPIRGITLIELLTAMAILAVLMALAWPAYTDSLRKARRVDAVTALQQVQLLQERYHAEHHRYAESLVELGYPDDEADSPQAYYRLRLVTPAAAGYLAIAEPRAGTDQIHDACGSFAVDASGPVADTPADPACWPR
jgi:type IV pilus assembly protein PilE